MKPRTISELMEDYNDALAANGLSASARVGKLHRCSVIIRRHETLGKDDLDEGIRHVEKNNWSTNRTTIDSEKSKNT